MVRRLTDENGKPKDTLSDDDIVWMKEALNFVENKLNDKKKKL